MTRRICSTQRALTVVMDRDLLWAKEQYSYVEAQLNFSFTTARREALKRINEHIKIIEHAFKGTLSCGGLQSACGRIHLARSQRLLDAVALGLKALHSEGRVEYSLYRNLYDLHDHSSFCLWQSVMCLRRDEADSATTWLEADRIFMRMTEFVEVLSAKAQYQNSLSHRFVANSNENNGTPLFGLWQQRAWAHAAISEGIQAYLPAPLPHAFAVLHAHHAQRASSASQAAAKYEEAASAQLAREKCVDHAVLKELRASAEHFAKKEAALYASAFPSILADTNALELDFVQAQDYDRRCLCLMQLLDTMEAAYRAYLPLEVVPRACELLTHWKWLADWYGRWISAVQAIKKAPLVKEGQDWEDNAQSELEPLVQSVVNWRLPSPIEVARTEHYAACAATAKQSAALSAAHQRHFECWTKATQEMGNYLACFTNGTRSTVARTFLARAQDYAMLAEGMSASAVHYATQGLKHDGEVADWWRVAAEWQLQALGIAYETVSRSTGDASALHRALLFPAKREKTATMRAKLADLLWRAERSRSPCAPRRRETRRGNQQPAAAECSAQTALPA